MKIGALARAVDCHVETVRYYEKSASCRHPIVLQTDIESTQKFI